MNQMKTHEILGLVVILTGVIDMFVLPRILLRPRPGDEKQSPEKIADRMRMMQLIIKIVVFGTVMLGLAFYFGYIPLGE